MELLDLDGVTIGREKGNDFLVIPIFCFVFLYLVGLHTRRCPRIHFVRSFR
jgi:hypothetical protein